jgi:hypothetical protein
MFQREREIISIIFFWYTNNREQQNKQHVEKKRDEREARGSFVMNVHRNGMNDNN